MKISMFKLLMAMGALVLLACTTKFKSDDGEEDMGEEDALGDEEMDRIDLVDVTDPDTLDPAEFDSAAECGNGETEEGEECDDGQNGNPDDGCTDECLFSCHGNDDCDDGDICNGSEICDVDHTCRAGANASEGTDCDDGVYCTDPDECDGSGTCMGTEKEFLFGVAKISSGGRHNCALLENSSAKCWGDNGQGQLGNGLLALSSRPVDVSVVESEMLQISPGFYHTCALLADGSVQCWGGNINGQLGDGTTDDSLVPVDVEGLSSGVTSIMAWSLHSCALVTGVGLKCWGQNTRGQLGDGTTTNSLTPVDVVGISEDISEFVLGDFHTCVLTAGGAVLCWGANDQGQLGTGTTDDSLSPVSVSGLSSGVVAITARVNHTCALMDTGEVRCWGDNEYGQLGDGTTDDKTTPVNVTGLTSSAEKVAAGGGHTCALLDTGGLMCWGHNSRGQCGDGTTDIRLTPVNVSGLSSGVVDLSLSIMNSCALLEWGTVKCWGRNDFGEVGDGTNAEKWSTADVVCM